MATVVNKPVKPVASKPASKPPSKTSAMDLLQKYEANLSGAGKGTEGNPNRDFQTASEIYWQSMGNQRAYADQLRGESRAHETNQLGIEVGAQKAQTKMTTDASKFGAKVGADTERYLGRLNLEGTRAQTQGRIKEAQIGAGAQQGVARIQAGAQRHQAELGLRSDLEGYASSERNMKVSQAGDNYRSGLQLAGTLLTNKDNNQAMLQSKFFDYMGNVAQSQWRAPDTSNIRYWGG